MNALNHSTTLELQNGKLHFAAAHFTIFSATERETLHGHDYRVYIALNYQLNEQGLNFDYRFYEEKAHQIIDQVKFRLLIPTKCEFLHIEEKDEYYQVIFNKDKMLFLKKDVILLPIHNITLEELSQWFLGQFIADQSQLNDHHIDQVTIKIYKATGQSASACWYR